VARAGCQDSGVGDETGVTFFFSLFPGFFFSSLLPFLFSYCSYGEYRFLARDRYD
jgi:hypothetical protein